MPNLVHRTEQALLGALIYDSTLADDVPYLLPRHFDDLDHQAVFATFLDIRADDPTATGVVMAERIAFQLDNPSIDQARLTGMALASPDVSSVAVYGRMIQEAALDRALAVHAERLAQAAGTVRGIDPELDHLALLSRALQTHTNTFTTDISFELSTDSASSAPGQDISQDIGQDADQDPRTVREEQVLADLIQHSEYVPEVAAWLDPEIFTSPDRRVIFEAIVAVDQYGEPVEELTLAWELARTQSNEQARDGQTRTADTYTAPGYMGRLAATAVETGAAIEIGRDLLAEHTRTELGAGVEQTGLGTGGTISEATVRHDLQHHALTHDQTPPLLTPPDHPLGLDGPELRQ